MRAKSRMLPVLVGAAVVILGLSACTGTPSVHPTTTPLPSSYATFTGAQSGKIYLSTCGANNNDTITVVVAGSTTRVHGVLSATSLSFDGKGSTYMIRQTGALPSFATDGTRVQLNGVVLVSVQHPSRKLTVNGTMVCP